MMADRALREDQRLELFQILNGETFTLDDLETLCFLLDVDWDNLEGAIKSKKAISIIRYFASRNEIPRLIQGIHAERPNCDLSIFNEGAEPRAAQVARPVMDPLSAAQTIYDDLQLTHSAFIAQCNVRNKLVAMVRRRLRIREHFQYEEFFSRYFNQMTPEELHFHHSIRSYTDGILYVYNKKILDLIFTTPELSRLLPSIPRLREHLVLWISKYEGLFRASLYMCVLYTGVEDGFPFPREVEGELERYIKNNGG